MSKTKDYINNQTVGLNTLITTKDKIKYILTDYENPLVNIDRLSLLLEQIVEDLTPPKKGKEHEHTKGD